MTGDATPALRQPMFPFILYILTFGTSSMYLSCMFLSSLILIWTVDDLTKLLENFDYKEFELAYIQRILQAVVESGRELSLCLCLVAVLSALSIKTVPLPVKLYLSVVYYFKTMYPLANMTDRFLESFICSSIFLLIAYTVYLEQLAGEIMSTLLFSLYGSVVTVAMAYEMQSYEIDRLTKRLFSFDVFGGDDRCSTVFVLVVFSVVFQHIIRLIFPKIRKLIQKS